MIAMHGGNALFGAVLAAALTSLVLWLLHPVAIRLNLLDYPRGGRKDHGHPTPVTGGIAIAVGSMGATSALIQFSPELMAFVAATLVIIVIGLLDDVYDIRWWWRILAQSTAALMIVSWGGVKVEQLGQIFGVTGTGLGAFSIPFTVFATVGLMNAINMIDGVDGLAGTLVLAALLMLAAAGLYAGNVQLTERVLILSGAVVAFLAYNARHPWRREADVFLGNAGSGFLGLVIAWVSFRLTQNYAHPVSPVLALWFLPIPVMDCLVLIVRRLRDGRSPFAAGRDHIHHLMIDSGFSPGRVAIALAWFSLACGLIAGQLKRMHVPSLALLLAFFALCISWYWLTLRRERAIGFFQSLSRPRKTAPGHLKQ